MVMNHTIDPSGYIMRLSNVLQSQGRLSLLTWGEAAAGHDASPGWTITAVIHDNATCTSNRDPVDGQECGWGTHGTKRGARQGAAQMTLQNLAMLGMMDE
ncbi:unnamed protein product [Rhizoctonia solani]|uniref:DRBM domain-containing protein n=1 Tax=Rhizoctonia solani TaxID=456999 RepID=A0A8H3DQI5_9AGAM|nr:unnamed protein product [Rhizoctonia solani]